jgi:hypothetical protein
MLVLDEGLRFIRGINYSAQDGYTSFTLARTSIQPYLHLGETLSLQKLIEISSSLVNPPLQ